MTFQVKCADCECLPSECKVSKSTKACPNCTWEECCCYNAIEKEYLRNWESEERHKKEFLRTIQELIDERDAQTKLESQQQSDVSISNESQGKSRKELFEEYEKKFLNELAVRSKERAEMRKKADEIVAKRLSES